MYNVHVPVLYFSIMYYQIENPKAQYISTTKYPGIVIYKSEYTKFLSIDVDTF